MRNSIHTSRRYRILHGHTHQYRVSTAALLGQTEFAGAKNPTEHARRFLERERADGYLDKIQTLVCQVPAPSKPLFHWKPGEPGPNVAAICYQLEKRWKRGLQRTTLYFATRKAKHAFGGYGSPLGRIHQVGHELLLTAIFLKLQRNAPEIAESWVGEDCYKHELRPGEKPGDARLMNDDGMYRIVEVLGNYSPQHVEALLSFFQSESIEYLAY